MNKPMKLLIDTANAWTGVWILLSLYTAIEFYFPKAIVEALSLNEIIESSKQNEFFGAGGKIMLTLFGIIGITKFGLNIKNIGRPTADTTQQHQTN